MGGQACVFYGAAQFSKDIDFYLLASAENYSRLSDALAELNAKRIAVPRFDPEILQRGHAVHFRCRGGDADGLRIDVMTRLRDLPAFEELWSRRTTITEESGETFNLLAVEDLVNAKKTQRSKDWPMIDALVEGHYRAWGALPNSNRIAFWLTESRNPVRLSELVARFPSETSALYPIRPLLQLATANDLDALREALDAEVRTEQARDREYWAPLKAEMEAFRRAERQEP